ncbi:MAG: hypothetical protein Q8N57_00620 [bacterium]|nr:hypothetical protein [bacterium]
MKRIKLIGLISLIGLIGPIGFIHAATIIDGDLIRAQGGVDVYIIKLIPSTSSGQAGEKFKRLILNPEIFNQYGHLKWENIKEVNQSEFEQYTVSDLVRAVSDDKVYKLYPNGDAGEKKWIKTLDDFLGFKYDWNSVYEVNNFERDFYSSGVDLTFSAVPASPEIPTPPAPPSRSPITINIPADYTTIQAAINASIDGDTINVESGTYNENIVINKSIKLIGELPTSIIVDGQGNGNAITITGGSDVWIQRIVVKSKDKYGIYCSSENAVKLTLKNSTLRDSERGLVTENNCQIVALNNVFYNNRNSANTDGGAILIKNTEAHGFVSEIINNTIDDNYHGIWSENANLKVINSIITNNIGGKGLIGNMGIYHNGSGSLNNTFSNAYGNNLDYGGDARPGNGSIVVLPRFVQSPQRDYRLQTGTTEYSLCIDAGHPDHIYDDLNYASNTARNDMGAYGGPDNIGWTP